MVDFPIASVIMGFIAVVVCEKLNDASPFVTLMSVSDLFISLVPSVLSFHKMAAGVDVLLN